ncbi:MAG: hypothetical protein H0W96_02955 [Solirubrobacterales bacterium]|nr:hypothetical protein [Solirubrobacterales bacterium]
MIAAAQRLLEHPISGIGNQLRAELDLFDGEAREHLEREYPGWIAQVGAAADWADGLPGLLDPRLVPFATLDSVHGQLDQARSHIAQAPSDPASANQVTTLIANAVHHAGGVSMAAPPLPELADAVGRKLGRAVSLRATALARELEELEASAASARLQLDEARNQATAADEQRVVEQQRRVDELAAAVEAERQRVDSFVTTAVNENQQAERDRQKTHAEVLKTMQAEGEDLVEKLREEADKQQADAATRRRGASARSEARALAA